MPTRPAPGVPTVADLRALPVTSLRSIAYIAGIRNWSIKSKADLVAELTTTIPPSTLARCHAAEQAPLTRSDDGR